MTSVVWVTKEIDLVYNQVEQGSTMKKNKRYIRISI